MKIKSLSATLYPEFLRTVTNGLSKLCLCAILFLSTSSFSDTLPSLKEVQAKFFPSGSQFTSSPIDLDKTQLKVIKKLAQVRIKPELIQLWQVSTNGVDSGWLFVDKVIGKHELITYALAVNSNGVITGLEVLEYLETHGTEIIEPSWRQQFLGKRLSNDKLKLGSDIDGVSGATLSCRNVTDGIRKLLILKEQINSK